MDTIRIIKLQRRKYCMDKVDNIKIVNVGVNVKNIMYISSILSFLLFIIAGYNIGDVGSISGINILGLFKSISYICYGFGVFSFSLLWYLGYCWNE